MNTCRSRPRTPLAGLLARALLWALLWALVWALVCPVLPSAAAGTWPLAPRPEVASGFVAPSQRWGPGHRGVDLVGLPGQAVRAPLAGRVAFVGGVAGVPVVSLAHDDGRRTTYQPVASALPVGQPLEEGEPLGALVPVGSHCAPLTCLHWGLKQGDAYLDPLSLLSPDRVRLLPLTGTRP